MYEWCQAPKKWKEGQDASHCCKAGGRNEEEECVCLYIKAATVTEGNVCVCGVCELFKKLLVYLN